MSRYRGAREGLPGTGTEGRGGRSDQILGPVLVSWKCRPLLSNFRVKPSPSGHHPGELWADLGGGPSPASRVAPEPGFANQVCQPPHQHPRTRRRRLSRVGLYWKDSWQECDWPVWEADGARTRFCLSNLIYMNPNYNSGTSSSPSPPSRPDLALCVSKQFMIGSEVFKTDPLQQVITYLLFFKFIFIY